MWTLTLQSGHQALKGGSTIAPIEPSVLELSAVPYLRAVEAISCGLCVLDAGLLLAVASSPISDLPSLLTLKFISNEAND